MILDLDYALTTGDTRITTNANILIDDGTSVYTIISHGNPKFIGDGSLVMGASEFAGRLSMRGEYGFNYNGEKTIKLYACRTAGKTKDGTPSFAAQLANLMNVTVIAPTSYVNVFPEKGNGPVILQELVGYNKKGEPQYKDGGYWMKCTSWVGCVKYLDMYGQPLK